MPNSYGFTAPSQVQRVPADGVQVRAREWVPIGGRRFIDVQTLAPKTWDSSKGWVLYTHGGGGQRKIGVALGQSVSNALGCAGIAMSHLGQGENGLSDYVAQDVRGTKPYTAIEIAMMHNVLTWGVERFGNTFAIRGDSQGWRMGLLARAWAGHTFTADDYVVRQGWVTAGETFPTPAVVLGGGWGPRYEHILCKDWGPQLRGNLFNNINTSAGKVDWDFGQDLNTPGNYIRQDFRDLITPTINQATSAAFKALMTSDELLSSVYDDTWTKQLASTVPAVHHISQLEAWVDVNECLEWWREIEVASGADIFVDVSTGNHQSSANNGEDANRSLRELAMLAFYLQGDTSRLSAMGNSASLLSEVPKYRTALIPNTQADYVDLDSTWEEFHVADLATLFAKATTDLYLQHDGTIALTTPGSSATSNFNREWVHQYDPAILGPSLANPSSPDLNDFLLNIGSALVANEIEFSVSVSAPLAKIVSGRLTLKDVYIQSDNAKTAIGVQVWLDDGVNDPVFMAGGGRAWDDFTTGSPQGPYDVELEYNSFRLIQGQTLIVRIVTYNAKERVYESGDTGRMVTMPFFDDATQQFFITSGSREPYLAATLWDEATQNGSDFLV